MKFMNIRFKNQAIYERKTEFISITKTCFEREKKHKLISRNMQINKCQYIGKLHSFFDVGTMVHTDKVITAF